MKNKLYFTALILGLVILFTLPTASSAADEFNDVPKDSAHYEGIQWLVGEGAISGYPEGDFRPSKALLRMHAAKIFVPAMKLDLLDKSKVENYFIDVKANDDYADYIATVGKAEIFTGSGGKFSPNGNLTREQMATTIVRAFDLKSDGTAAPIYLGNVDPAHQDNVQILADLGITKELEDFRPRGAITRGQFATFLYRTNNVLNGKEPEPSPGPSIEIIKQPYDYNFKAVIDDQMTKLQRTDVIGKWYDASRKMVEYYANPANFNENSNAFYQFLKLSGSSGISAKNLNESILYKKGTLHNEGNSFILASQTHNVNEIYLISHALLETGHGTSNLASGIEVGLNKNDKPEMVTEKNRQDLKEIKTTYNMYGIGAIDSCSGGSSKCGAEKAYEEGWFTPGEAIVGGAKFIGENYISAGQDTLYKMRWNPAVSWHQYATDVGWAVKQTPKIKEMFDLYHEVDGLVLTFEVPVYKNQPAASALPTGIDIFDVDTDHKYVGEKAKVNADPLNFREGPTTKFSIISELPKDTEVEIVGHNSDWYKISVNGKLGWVLGEYLDFADEKVKPASFTSPSNANVVEEDPYLNKIFNLPNIDFVPNN